MISALSALIPPKRLPLLIAGSAAAVLAAANFFEYVLGYAPCQLCLYQRIPWWIALGLGCAAMMLTKRRGTLSLIVVLTALLAVAAGAGIAGYHAGVEYKFWPGPSGCTGTQEISGSLSAAIGNVQDGPAPPACDEVPWSLFGISMAGYNFFLSLGLVALSALVLNAARR